MAKHINVETLIPAARHALIKYMVNQPLPLSWKQLTRELKQGDFSTVEFTLAVDYGFELDRNVLIEILGSSDKHAPTSEQIEDAIEELHHEKGLPYERQAN